jgi:hypothetical protein
VIKKCHLILEHVPKAKSGTIAVPVISADGSSGGSKFYEVPTASFKDLREKLQNGIDIKSFQQLMKQYRVTTLHPLSLAEHNNGI